VEHGDGQFQFRVALSYVFPIFGPGRSVPDRLRFRGWAPNLHFRCDHRTALL